MRSAEVLAGTCGGCRHWRPEPLWKQALFFWRGGLWLGRCAEGCYGGDLAHWSTPCPSAFFAGRSKPASPEALPSTKGLAAASLPTIADPVKEGGDHG